MLLLFCLRCCDVVFLGVFALLLFGFVFVCLMIVLVGGGFVLLYLCFSFSSIVFVWFVFSVVVCFVVISCLCI